MEVDPVFNKTEIIAEIKKQAINRSDYNDLIQILQNSIKDSTNHEDNITYIFTLLMQNKLDHLNLIKSIYKQNLDQEQFNHISNIFKKLSKEPYCNIYEHVQYFLRINSINVQNIILAYLNSYEREQASYIANLYSKLKVQTLNNYISGNNITSNDLTSYLNKYLWTIDGEAIITKEVKSNFIINKSNLDFINQNTVILENIAKSNNLIIK